MIIRNIDGDPIKEIDESKLEDQDLREAGIFVNDLRGVDLMGAHLEGAYLKEFDLTRANFEKANLSESDLRGSKLDRVNLKGASLRGADLRRAVLYECDLTGADLTGADLTGADVSHTKDIISFSLTKHFGYAWKKEGKIIVKIGCIEHPIEYWVDNAIFIGKENGYTDYEIEIYKAQIELIQKYF